MRSTAERPGGDTADPSPLLLDRRQFFGVTLLGLTRKAGRPIAGSFVNESHEPGHRLRDGGPFPEPRETQHVPILIVGAGIAGLSAAWRLQRRGMDAFVVLEMERQAGGNARWGENEVSPYPWAAHYVPVPGRAGALVRELFADLGIYEPATAPAPDAAGTHGWNARHLCHAPQERLFIHGRWQEGLEPVVGPTARDRDQLRRFEDRMAGFAATGEFTVPMAAGVRPSPLDTISMRRWLEGERLDSPWLAWLVDYACRDDYGAAPGEVSAWAGIHYFASREPEEQGPLTWPEGNGWIVRRLLERVGARVRTDAVAYRIERAPRGWRVLTPSVSWICDALIVAAPAFVTARLMQGAPRVPDFEYSPWLTANLTLDRWPVECGVPPAWDNVIFDSPGLGYVVATHQSLKRHVPRTVWTYYWALSNGSAAHNRRWLLRQEYPALRDRVLDDLSRAHPDIRECVSRVDVMRMGHAMIRPTVGFLASAARRELAAGLDRLYFAHSDLSGLALFEEAQHRGVTAADATLRALGHDGRPAHSSPGSRDARLEIDTAGRRREREGLPGLAHRQKGENALAAPARK